MTRYRIEVRPGVERWFRKLRDERLKVRLTEAMAGLADNPLPVGVLKLQGRSSVIGSGSGTTGSSMKSMTVGSWC